MKTLVPPTPDPAAIDRDLPAYLLDQAERCPFLQPSSAGGRTLWSAVDATSASQVLTATVDAAEHLRLRRRTVGMLACSAIAFPSLQPGFEAQLRIELPHWIAQNLYGPVGLMLMFRIAQADDPGASPVSFIVVRSTLPERDLALMHSPGPDWPDVSYLVNDGSDDGHDVFTVAFGHPVPDPAAVYRRLVSMFPIPGQRDSFCPVTAHR